MEIIDCDVHVYPRNAEEIKRYLPQPWKHRFHIWSNAYYAEKVEANRTVPPNGAGPGTDPDFLIRQLIKEEGVAQAILLPRANVSIHHDPDQAAMEASAYNNWLSDTWLTSHNPDGVFKGSITIAHQDPAAAAKEIEKWADHQHMVQVIMDTGARAPFGQRHYYPIYEACARHRLPLALHPGTDGMGVNILASQGYPSHFLEWYAGFSLSMQVHLLSLLTEGVFERFPELKMIFVEGGIAWLPALMWRLDQEYKGLRSEIPWTKQMPSLYLKEHVRFTTHPLERPEKDGDLTDVLAMMNCEDLLLYASNYPHQYCASPRDLHFLPETFKPKIFAQNAKQLYRL